MQSAIFPSFTVDSYSWFQPWYQKFHLGRNSAVYLNFPPKLKDYLSDYHLYSLGRYRNILIFTCFIIGIVVKIIRFVFLILCWCIFRISDKSEFLFFKQQSCINLSVDSFFQICSRQVSLLIFLVLKKFNIQSAVAFCLLVSRM